MNRIRALFNRRQQERDLSDEIAQHLDEKVEELMATGLSRRDAELAAHRAFGSVTLTNERGRAVWRWALLEDLRADVRYAARQLRRTPAFAAAAILTLAVGIGANTAVFSLVNAMVLKPLPYPAADRLVAVHMVDRRDGHAAELDYFTFFELRRAGIFAHLTSYRQTSFTLTGRGTPVRLAGEIVGWELFDTLGVRPALGRGFLANEEVAGSRAVVISHELWTTLLGSDPQIVGQALSLDGVAHTVVGVAPPGFRYPAERAAQIWTTIARDASSPTLQPVTEQRGARLLDCLATLRPGQTIEEAEGRAGALTAALARDYPGSNRNYPGATVRPELQRTLGSMRGGLFILWGAVGLVLLIACANLANMLLARSADRQRELGVRLAIGASRGRVTRQLVTENLVLAIVGSAIGAGSAMLVTSALVSFMADQAPRVAEVSLDWRVLAFTIGLATVASVLVSLPAALAIRRIDVDGTLRGESRSVTDAHDRVRSTLVIAQVAVGLMLLTAASLLASGLLQIARRDPGFRPANLVAFTIALPAVRYRDDGHVRFTERLLDSVRALGGVQSAAGSMSLPLTDQMVFSFEIEERPQPPSERPRANFSIVTPGYFSTIGARLVDGRDFTEDDDPSHPRVVIVNEAFAARFFPGVRAIGKRIATGPSSRFETDGRKYYREIVGIVGNVTQSQFSREPQAIHYLPYRQMPWQAPKLLVRTTRESTPGDVRRLVAAIDPDLPVEARTLQSVFEENLAVPRLATWLMGSFAGIGLLLTATGLYGLLSYAVLRRTRELGVRLALGASRGRIVASVVSRALILVAIGLALGSVGAAVVTRLLKTVVFAPTTSSPLPFVGVVCVIVLTAVIAAALPARRAASIDPTIALRGE